MHIDRSMPERIATTGPPMMGNFSPVNQERIAITRAAVMPFQFFLSQSMMLHLFVYLKIVLYDYIILPSFFSMKFLLFV